MPGLTADHRLTPPMTFLGRGRRARGVLESRNLSQSKTFLESLRPNIPSCCRHIVLLLHTVHVQCTVSSIALSQPLLWASSWLLRGRVWSSCTHIKS